ncbi:lysoplasmalogenase [Bacillus sp. 1P06AnD]|uniref:lysoplasmalogenase n=1 Tax=Bacillus sp. 1P06AnD TaxID=3132208 RepID=UPI0039A01B5B
MKKNIILVLFFITALLFIFFIPKENEAIRLMFKILPMCLLMLLVLITPSPLSKKWILAGLLFCTLGDALIIYSFIFGLGSFLVGHLFYIAYFASRRKRKVLSAMSFIPLIAYGLFMGFKLAGSLQGQGENGLIAPVILYILAISLMGWTAAMTHSRTAILGSLLFIASDSILSWNLFVSPIAYHDSWIMVTYYAAQCLISLSMPAKSKDIYISRTNYQYK